MEDAERKEGGEGWGEDEEGGKICTTLFFRILTFSPFDFRSLYSEKTILFASNCFLVKSGEMKIFSWVKCLRFGAYFSIFLLI